MRDVAFMCIVVFINVFSYEEESFNIEQASTFTYDRVTLNYSQDVL